MPTVIITGASTGIGYQLAFIMAREGYDLGLIARRKDLLEAVQEEVTQKYPGKVFVEACDVSDDQACRTSIQSLAKQLGKLDIFVANAGIGVSIPAWINDWPARKRILDTNIQGALAGIEAAKELMLVQKHGHLVGISSVAATRGLPTAAPYCASKAALATYLESTRLDLKSFGIKVTSIHPGFIWTPMTQKNKFHMPFLLSVEKGTELIYRAIKKQKKRYVLPWQLKPLVWISRRMPDWMYDALMGFLLKFYLPVS